MLEFGTNRANRNKTVNILNFNKEENLPILPKTVSDSPLFIWDDPSDDKLISIPDFRDVIELLATEPNILPFKEMRLYCKANPTDKANGLQGTKFWLQHSKGELSLFAKLRWQKSAVGRDLGLVFAAITQPEYGRYGVGFMRDGKPVKLSEIPPTVRLALENTGKAVVTSVSWFVRDITAPSNFTVQVSPEPRGRSVEWIKSRSHYVIIDKGHPANSKRVSHGSSVANNEQATLQRQAHTRRAHTRKLSSPRFRKKQGQVVFVKSSWVGPEEWKTGDSIYRVITKT